MTSVPSGSWTSSGRSLAEAISSRPSGSQSMLNGSSRNGIRSITSLPPAGSTATISCATQFESHRRPSCQRGDSPNVSPVASVRRPVMVAQA